jgi:pimeloyl-ACP methyl ester carboxylesterase
MTTDSAQRAVCHRPVYHRTIDIDGVPTFYREAGDAAAPVLLLPHGYPCSSYQFRQLMPRLADRWRLVAPDFPGFGYSATPRSFAYGFDGFARFLDRFVTALGIGRFALYLHDYGSQIGLRLALQRPERVAALIIQNGDIYEDQLGPKYEVIRRYWSAPTDENRRPLEQAVSEEGFRHEFVGEVPSAVAASVPPDLWTLHWTLMNTPERRALAVDLMVQLKENLSWFPRYQRYLREHQPPSLIVWGPEDGYMPEGAARAYLRDLPDAELHLISGAGHWLLETHFESALPRVRGFLERVLSA